MGTEPPEEPTEPDLVTPGEGEPDIGDIPPAGGKLPAPHCDYKRVYTPKANHGRKHKGVGATQSNYNGTTRTARSTFISEVTGEVGVSVTAGLSTSVDAMIGKIEAKYDVELSAKLTAKLGNNVAVDTPPKTTTNAKFGVWRLKNTGVSYVIYSNCQGSAKKNITSYSPMKVGWHLWES
ncbi:hypothetical protein [Streptomyces albidochromogenes]|uniref:hypothetical protein n=1 Tax=Streptomyces albidochromogenes TaxID=329524 RepID=UPI00110FA68A|nr:hypothetical protein [Streptomyces albidochromogenes]